jgi:hypothetical protein
VRGSAVMLLSALWATGLAPQLIWTTSSARCARRVLLS